MSKKKHTKLNGKQSFPTAPVTVNQQTASEPSEKELAKMVAARISALEDTKNKSDALKFSEKGFIRNQIESFSKELKQIADDPASKGAKLIELHDSNVEFFTRLETLFLSEVTSHKKDSDDLTQTKATLATFQKLCRSLQNEKNAMKKKFAELKEIEKKWRSDLEMQFEQSIKEIRSQISNHEITNNSILEDNEKLRCKTIELMKQHQKYLQENDLLKRTMEKKDEHAIRGEIIRKNLMTERDNLTEHLKTSLDMNKDFNTKWEESRAKCLSLQDALTQSTEYITQLKTVNGKLQSGMKALHKTNDEFLKKAKTYQTQSNKLQAENMKLQKQNTTLTSLSRKLRSDLRELRAECEISKDQARSASRKIEQEQNKKRKAKEASTEKAVEKQQQESNSTAGQVNEDKPKPAEGAEQSQTSQKTEE